MEWESQPKVRTLDLHSKLFILFLTRFLIGSPIGLLYDISPEMHYLTSYQTTDSLVDNLYEQRQERLDISSLSSIEISSRIWT